MKNRSFFFLLVFLIAVAVFLKLKNPDKFEASLFSKINAVARKDSSEQGPQTTGVNVAVAVDGGLKPAAENFQVTPEFVSWFSNEADKLEKPSQDPKEIEANLLTAAEKLIPAEIQFLKTKAINMQGPANDRIFAMYMLTLAPQVTVQALVDIVKMPLVMNEEQQVHSPEETLAAQERSLRRMAIDALIERGQKETSGKDVVKAAIDQITDASLRNYAEKKIERAR